MILSTISIVFNAEVRIIKSCSSHFFFFNLDICCLQIYIYTFVFSLFIHNYNKLFSHIPILLSLYVHIPYIHST